MHSADEIFLMNETPALFVQSPVNLDAPLVVDGTVRHIGLINKILVINAMVPTTNQLNL